MGDIDMNEKKRKRKKEVCMILVMFPLLFVICHSSFVIPHFPFFFLIPPLSFFSSFSLLPLSTRLPPVHQRFHSLFQQSIVGMGDEAGRGEAKNYICHFSCFISYICHFSFVIPPFAPLYFPHFLIYLLVYIAHNYIAPAAHAHEKF